MPLSATRNPVTRATRTRTGSSIGTRPRLRPASHWRQKTAGGSPSGRWLATRGRAPSAAARQRGEVAVSEPIMSASLRPAHRVRPRVPRCRRSRVTLSRSGHLHDPLSRLQGVVRRRAGDPRAGCSQMGTSRRQERADIAVINTCCVTNEAVAKSRQAAAQAARTHDRVYVTGCAANLPDGGVCRAARRTSRVVAEQQRRAGRRRRRRGWRDRMHPGGSPARPHPCVRQDPGRLLVLVRVLRDPARPRRHAQSRRRGSARRDSPPRGARASRGRAHRRQPRLLPRPGCRACRFPT